VDTFTKYTWIYFLKAKSDALQAVKQFLALVHTQFNISQSSLFSLIGVVNFVPLPPCLMNWALYTDLLALIHHTKMGQLRESIDK
jgi:hypothetical protein